MSLFDFFVPKKPAYKDEIGRSTWLLLHAMADHFPLDESATLYGDAFTTFLQSLSHLYPCAACREHLQAYLKMAPPRFDNRAHAVRWVYSLHNAVNLKIGKKQFSTEEYATRLQSQFSHVQVGGLCAGCTHL